MNRTEPLGLPRGSVRAILTILLVLVCAAMLFVGTKDKTVAAMFVLLTGIAVRDYFVTRAASNERDGEQLDVTEGL